MLVVVIIVIVIWGPAYSWFPHRFTVNEEKWSLLPRLENLSFRCNQYSELSSDIQF